jgi:hypothetical protein
MGFDRTERTPLVPVRLIKVDSDWWAFVGVVDVGG